LDDESGKWELNDGYEIRSGKNVYFELPDDFLPDFSVRIIPDLCDDDANDHYDLEDATVSCDGPAKIIVRAHSADILEDGQVMQSEDVSFNPDEISSDRYELLSADDVNFDGHPDLMIRNGNHGGYGGPSFDVYIFDTTQGQFLLNEDFSSLTRGSYLGLFDIYTERQEIRTYSKSGCCYHEEEIFIVKNNKPVAVRKIIEDVTVQSEACPDREIVRVTIKEPNENKEWVISSEKDYGLEYYYSEWFDPDDDSTDLEGC